MENINKFVAILWLPLLALSFLRLPPVPPDFAFKISGMFHDEINTFSGTYSRNGVKKPAKKQMFDGELIEKITISDSTVSLKLTSEEKCEIYSALCRMDYEYYPQDISAKCKLQIIPSHKVQLKIRANNVVRYISCEDGCQDNNTQVKSFRRLINLIEDIAARHAEVQKIPQTMMFDL